MSLTATNAQVYKGTAAVTYGSGSGVSNRELQGTASVTYGGAPTSNTALVTGSSNYMKLPTTDPTNFDPSTSNVFIEAWVYWNGANWTPPSLGTIYERDNVSVQDYGLYVDGSVAKLTAYMYTQNGNILRPIYNPTLTVQTWIHVAFGYNIANQTAYVWVNGNIGTTASVSNPARYTGSSIFTSIGASPLNGVTTAYWNGYIQDLRVVKGGNIPTTSFTPAQAPFRLNVPPYVTGGSTVLSLAEQYFTPSWLSLPGTTGAYMALGTTHPSNFDTSVTNFFVECWVYPRSIPTSSTVQYIVLRGTGVYGAEDIGLRILSTGYAEFYSFGAGTTIAIPNSGVALSANKWYHLAGSIVSSTKTVYIFLDGVLKNSATMAGAPRTTAGSNFFIGTPTVQTDWVATNAYIQDLRVTQGGTIPTTSFTPAAAPFGLASPSYVSGGTTVLSLATQYYQTGMTNYTDASGSTITYVNGYKTHTFTTVGTFTFTLKQSISSAQVLVVAGGGAGGAWSGAGGGGAGGLIYVSSLSLPAGSYTVTVGSGGTAPSGSGANSVFSTYTAIGGGGGATNGNGFNGGSGGGSQSPSGVGSGTAGQGNNGGQSPSTGPAYGGGGGGGAGAVGQNGTGTFGGKGGDGLSYSISGSPVYYAGGGGGSYVSGGTDGLGGLGGGGRAVVGGPGIDGTPNTGGGGGASGVVGGTGATRAGAGGSGIVIISYPIGIQFTSRPILPAVLTNPGNNFALVSGQTITVAQTALEPANGITWGFSPTGSGLAVTSSTDYALNLVVNSTPILPNTYTVSATNKSGLTTVVQFSGSTQLIFGLFASPTATGTWYGFSYTIFTPQNSGVYPLVSLYGTSPLNSTVWDSGGVYSPGSGLPTSGASFNAYLPGTSTYGDYTRVQFSSGIVFSSVYIGLNGTNYNPISNVAVYGSNTGTAPWTQLFYGPSGLLESNYNTGTASFVKFTFTTTGSFTNYACQIPTVLPSHGNNPSTGCLYWST